MNNHLFQSAEFYQRRYHNFATILVLPLTLLVLFIVLFSLFAHTEITVTSTGEITPTKVIEVIQSTSNNIISTNNLKDNKTVKKGDLLVKYSDKLEASQSNSIQQQIDRDDRQAAALETLINSLKQGTNLFGDNDEFGYSSTINAFLNQAITITSQVNQANVTVAKQEESVNKANSSIPKQITELQTQVNQYQEPQSDIDNLNLKLSSNVTTGTYDNSASSQIETLRNQQVSQAQEQLNQVNKDKESLQAQLEQANIRKEATSLYANSNGVLHLNSQIKGESYIPQGTVIGQIYPNLSEAKNVAITYYVNSNYINQLKKQQTVRFTLNTVGKTPTVIKGEIVSLDKAATETKNGNFFKVTAKVNVTSQDREHLTYGMQGKVVSVIAKKTFFNYFKDKLLNNN
ncbi:HlyD family efflux transporter periplasmic adaptor subunit [Streptococcus sp. HSISS3]|jgi:blpC ABC superfamily ATP binding cassette transporter|uniref:HlyD family efflux transporter periplasmic adaptor subunit n=1 Tax=Streptococcus sp. HSISS3 TaxID=1316412 RepID=UPI00038B259E|nr:Competence-stimulating peptide ABC transporter permease protein ComB [Streptococcus sp. HSISS3]EQC75486.1 Competence-stimulating peptide ABC transporter permease protein ComB [Streptococcus sp. HSISS3]